MKQPIRGIISLSAKGTGYVKVPGFKEDVEIDFRHLRTALDGDTVEMILHPKTRWQRQTGEVKKVIARAKAGFVGTLYAMNSAKEAYGLRADDRKMYADILVPAKKLSGAKPGDKVYVEIKTWNDSRRPPEGEVKNVLGRAGENGAEMRAIATERGFKSDFPEAAHKEAENIRRRGIKKEDFAGRRDFRGIPTFTIDPEDAKDFDDAISLRELDDGSKRGEKRYEVGVHIADVTHFVRPEGALDREARRRGTSVYLVDRTIPMLPEVLSNDLCSLIPKKDRLAMSAVFTLDRSAHVKEEWYGRTVIRSKKRLSYEEAEHAIKDPNVPEHRELAVLSRLAKKLLSERFEKGAISLEQEEVKFVLDKDGKPVKVTRKERSDSHKMVEEFMLLANRRVAKYLSPGRSADGKAKNVSLYRVHDRPSREKMEELVLFLKTLGYEPLEEKGIISNREINKLLEKMSGRNEADTVHRAVIRSMAKAVYSTKNIGHYGLAFRHYTHFTSPIRRYPDMVIHRLLTERLRGKKTGRDKLRLYESICLHASERERAALDAERASVKYKQVEYMSARIGKVFPGIISGVAEWGVYVEETESKCEGLVRARDLRDDFYVLNEKKQELRGRRSGKIYRLGDRVRVRVKSANLSERTVDYEFA